MLDEPAIRWIIQQLLNGNAFYLAMGLVAFAAVSTWVVHEPGRWTKIGRRAAGAVGIVLLAMTVSFLSFSWIACLAVLVALCLFRKRMPPSKTRYVAIFLLFGLAIYNAEFFRAGSPTEQPPASSYSATVSRHRTALMPTTHGPRSSDAQRIGP